MLTKATVVTPSRVIEGGTVVVADGIIPHVLDRSYAGDAGAIELGGRMVTPGIVCLHNDAIEREINPQPGAEFDPAFALSHLDRNLAMTGVTTQFHAVSFLSASPGNRTLDPASLL